jgi:proteasome accessory factor C
VDYYPVTEVCDLPDGGVSVLLRVADPAWLNRLVLGLGEWVRGVEPASVAASLHELAGRALAGYSEEIVG